jgi:alginate O-acetyltransferase complex protein AlgI
MERFILGLAKKMLIANPLGAVVDSIFALPPETVPTHVAWFGILLYALQIYYDFSGYSDMAIGLGRMLGFRFLENFNYPYSAQTLQDFWRRWHISLSTWFRDYLYIPLGGNRGSSVKTYFNLFCVFFLCGLWHGASWNFLFWGMFHGVILALERAGLSRLVYSLPRFFRHLYLLVVVLVSWVFFRAENLGAAVDYLQSMFNFQFFSVPFEFIDAINPEVLIALIAGLLLSFPGVYRPLCGKQNVTAYKPALVEALRFPILFGLLFLSAMQLAASTHNPFIYFRF